MRTTAGSVGYDLFASESVVIQPKTTEIVKTGLSFEIPFGYEMQIRPRSGISLKTDLIVMLGTIDSDYRGQVGIICKNIGEIPFEVSKGDRLAQFVLNKVELMEVEEVIELSKTDRGSGGFGSTGIQQNELKKQIDEINNHAK